MDPYEVLGLKRGASKDEVKAAYRNLVKQYHPDKHVNNPLKDLAAEKFKEIQEAYDKIMNEEDNSYSYSSSSSSSNFQIIRQYISARRFSDALALLNNDKNRNAEWNYLTGVCYINLGSVVQGIGFLQTACHMDPNNIEYRNYLNNIRGQQQAYQTRSYNYGRGNDCDCCTQLICADCCCECMGGDLIACC